MPAMDAEPFTVWLTLVSAPDQKPFPFRIEFPPDLPITARAGEIVDAIRAHPVVILAGETGSGKTTQIPKLCLAAGGGVAGKIACTQPRRVAALSVSRRVAEELGVTWGREVGCKVRFDDRTSRDTVIKFLTDGMLLAEVQGDSLLRAYDTIIIDEAHERSLNIDFLLGHLRQLRHKRPELKIVITSATIDTQAFAAAFDGAPIIEVSGRTYPVEVIYAPLDALGSDAATEDEPGSGAEALHYIDGAVEAVQRVLAESRTGDVLVFMPSERDIRETCDVLAGRERGVELVPLFGRLSNAEQQRVFAPGGARRVIVATNIAETSLTLPGIRYVVDTGLARISRYAPQGRTRRLPIEAVAQASADQRKGRAGRVAEGVCIRLYSEADFLARPRFMQPEIQRANLADVILRLQAFGLREIERFPFINMPAVKSIRAGYGLLEELGAIETGAASGGGEVAGMRRLTPVGRELARLPVDPTVGRMILQARQERALREVLVIAAGLSVQDPRERPLDKQAAADVAHRRFAHPDSDFLTLLNIWEAVHDEVERLSQAKLRRFCREHFLSYTRLREWRDIYAQLVDTIAGREDLAATSVWDGVAGEERTPGRLRFGQAAYAAIHRSVLAGLLGNVATRDEHKGGYAATHSRKVVLFPGSALFTREERKTGPTAAAKKGGQKEARGPRWIMAAEIMETSRLYARTCARLDPLWALELGSHLLNVSHSEPFWDEAQGRVLVRRKTRLYGLEIDARAVGYGRIEGWDATDIFIREALVNDTITRELPFLVHNRAVREKVELELTRRRDRGLLNLDEAVYRFYAEALIGDAEEAGELPWGVVSSVAELAALVRARAGVVAVRGEGTLPVESGQGDEAPHRYATVRGGEADERFLWLSEEQLRPPEEAAVDPAAFPPSLPVDNRVLPLSYAYRPGQEEDGVTLDVSVREAEGLSAVALDWAVPGHLAAKVEHYLRALPKELRRSLMPFAETARRLTGELAARDRLSGRRELIREALAARLGEKLGLRIAPAVWDERPLPSHLQVRVRVVDDAGRELGASRDLAVVREAIEAHQRKVSAAAPRAESAAWRKAREAWETTPAEAWPEGREGREVLPAEIEIGEQAGVPVKAYPFLGDTGGGVAVRLGRTVEQAAAGQAVGVRRLLALGLRYEIAWLEKDLKALRELGALAAMVGGVDALRGQALGSIVTWVTEPARVAGSGRTRAAVEAALEAGRVALRGLVPRLGDRLREILDLRQALLVHPTPYAGLAEEVTRVVPADFMRVTPWERLEQVPRYLKARRLRAERWRQNPSKDAERAAEVAVWEKKLAKVEDAERAERLRWLVEEYRVSVFAQELGTAEPVSAAKLARVWRGEAEGGERGAATTGAAAAPKPLAVTLGASGAKPKTLKSLNALDGLFRR